jgi:hypothetical protein
MLKPVIKIGALSLLGIAIAALPVQSLAQTTNKPAAEKKEPAAKKPSAGPFHGKLAAVDKTAKTITVGKRTFQITSETKIIKGGKPAKLEDGVVDETVSGYVKPTDDGKLVATKVTFGPKVENKDGEKKKASTGN